MAYTDFAATEARGMWSPPNGAAPQMLPDLWRDNPGDAVRTDIPDKTDDELVAMPIGEYELESGEILVVKEEGLIEELKEAKIVDEEANGPTSHENDYNMNFKKVSLGSICFVFILTFLFVLVDSPIVIWNKSVVFPEFLSSFETWAKLKESQLEELTIYLVSFDNFNEYLIGIIAIAITPIIYSDRL